MLGEVIVLDLEVYFLMIPLTPTDHFRLTWFETHMA